MIFRLLSPSHFKTKYNRIPHNETEAKVWLLGNENELSVANWSISGLGLCMIIFNPSLKRLLNVTQAAMTSPIFLFFKWNVIIRAIIQIPAMEAPLPKKVIDRKIFVKPSFMFVARKL